MSNFNFLIALDYTNYFNVTTTRGIELITAICLLGTILLGLLVMYLVKKEYVKPYLKISGIVVVAFALAIAIANIIMDFQEGETYTEKYQTIIISVFAVIVVAFIIMAFLVDNKSQTKEKNNTKSLVYAAISIALSFGLSYIRIFKAPYGGSITLASMLPIALYSYMFGVRKGLICGLIYGILQSIQDPWIIHPIQYLMDYPFAFAMIGLCGGMFRKVIKQPMLSLSLGMLVGAIGRYLCHVISGAVFFGEYAADYGFTSPWVYSFAYNALFVFPDIAIAIVAGIGLLASKTIRHQMDQICNSNNTKKEDLLSKPSVE